MIPPLLVICGYLSDYPTFSPGQSSTADRLPAQGSDNIEPAMSVVSHTPPQTALSSASVNGNSAEQPRDQSPSFYGATSHPHVVSPGEELRPGVFGEIEDIGVDLDPSSPHLRDHLFQSFFKYQTLWVDIVDRESFFIHRGNGANSRWYSKFLENAILACGTRLSTSKAVRSLGLMYLEWAKHDVVKAISEPTPANLQGFLLLSEYEVTQGNDRPGWMFCGKSTIDVDFVLSRLTCLGVACRMLSDLGLHELASAILPPTGATEPTRESDLAYALLSACVVYEGVWTLYLGRPSSIPRSVMCIAASRCKSGRKTDSAWLNAWVGLCVPMAEISHILNERSVTEAEGAASLRKLLEEIEQWYASLPPELAYIENRLTSMDLAGYGIHTQYCKVQILLRRALSRPHSTRKRRYSQITSNSNLQTSFGESSAIIYKYALRIARLVVTYREAFGSEKIPSIMLDNAVVAATTMIEILNDEVNLARMQHETVWLRQLVKSMDAVQAHFPITGRMLDSLKQMCGNGPLCSIFPSNPRDHIYPATQDASSLDRSRDFNSRLNRAQFGNGSNAVWDGFDVDLAPVVAFSSGFDHFILDLPPPEAVISELAQ
jgi:hypothetical protein